MHNEITNFKNDSQINREEDENEDEADNLTKMKAMIECTEFVENLMTKKKNKRDKFEHVLQNEEIISDELTDEIKNKFLNKKRLRGSKLNMLAEGNEISIDELVELDWRKQGLN